MCAFWEWKGVENSTQYDAGLTSLYSPEWNPVENMWQEIGEKSGLNLSFESMEQLEMDLAPGRMKLENEP